MAAKQHALRCTLSMAIMVAAFVGNAAADHKAGHPAISDACVYPKDEKDVPAYMEHLLEKFGKNVAFQNPPEAPPPTSREKQLELIVQYTDKTKKIVAGCPVKLRSYNGELVGPTIRAKPGDTLYIKLNNKLPYEKHTHPQDQHAGHDGHFSFNITNLHTHGLHTSPQGNGDNVFISVYPRQMQEYEIHIPDRHPAGTFWYHAHYHGSTAIQVASGMSGALIVEGGEDAKGGLDSVTEIKAATDNGKEKIFLLQQINFNDSGEIEKIEEADPGAPFPRNVTVNGQFVPTITMRPGEVQRWRFIHAGVNENIQLVFEGHSLHEIAADGIALGRMVSWPAKEDIGGRGVRWPLLGPGYRIDVLVQAGAAGPGGAPREYLLRSDPLPPELSLRASAFALRAAQVENQMQSLSELRAAAPRQPQDIIARVLVAGEPVAMDLPKLADLALRVPSELTEIKRAELTDKPQAVRFDAKTPRICDADGDCSKVCTGLCLPPSPFHTESKRPPNTVNGRVYMGRRPDRILAFGQASEWTLSGDGAFPHPFHMHVNPFQAKREEPDGNGMRTTRLVWKDTILIPIDGSITVQSRYTKFGGDFVLHCHILSHEDRGMMEWVRIETPR